MAKSIYSNKGHVCAGAKPQHGCSCRAQKKLANFIYLPFFRFWGNNHRSRIR
jgi:hypothetical protein